MLVWMLAIGIALVGLAAAGVGLRGRRVNDHPICRGCGFDLVGLAGRRGGEDQNEDAESTDLRAGQARDARCPECGRELSRRRAVRVGARRRRRMALVAGLLLFLTGSAWTGALAWGRAQSFDWNTVKPTWLLMMETRQPTADNAEAGMRELLVRLELGALSRRQIDRIVAQILAAQGTAELPWHESWGNFIQTAHDLAGLTEEQLELYGRQAVADAMRMGAVRYQGGRLEYPLILARPRAAGQGGRWWLQPELLRMRAGNVTVDTAAPCGTFAFSRSGTGTTMPSVKVVLPEGGHEVTLILRYQLCNSDWKPLATWQGELRASIDVGAVDAALLPAN